MIPEEIRDKIPVIDGKLVVNVLEALFGQQLMGKTIIQIMDDWLDISLSMSEDCLNLNVAKPAVRKQSSCSDSQVCKGSLWPPYEEAKGQNLHPPSKRKKHPTPSNQFTPPQGILEKFQDFFYKFICQLYFFLKI